jgi:hypothetical protein
LDEQKLEVLRRWGQGLTEDQRSDARAVGRAILMLIEEIERLHVDLWHASDRATEAGLSDEPPTAEAGLFETLRRRVRRPRGNPGEDSHPQAASPPVEGSSPADSDASASPDMPLSVSRPISIDR